MIGFVKMTRGACVAALLLGSGALPAVAAGSEADRLGDFVARAPVAAHRHHGRVHVAGHRVIRSRAVGPVLAEPVLAEPRYPYVDDGSRYDTEYDGSAIGREGDLIPREGSGPRYVRQGGSFELSGPPISPSLPVVPELVDPSLY